ncbi:hypothetical protein EJ08DRAFT_707900 [Tothia fuscella]|uniref:SprT-like domain-containing protein n=1 Tax=Tothia fuscella TaxID=1048955 RepID=A0A9P4U1Y7_9PEZI|nr:hypothetical protein EJ08DRAFT_707900 [Tothia fuscella]
MAQAMVDQRENTVPVPTTGVDCQCIECRPNLYTPYPHTNDPSHADAPFMSEGQRHQGFAVNLPDACGYSVDALARALEKSISENSNTPRKESAIKEWKRWSKTNQNKSYHIMTGPTLSYLFALMNEIFFHGAIRNTTIVSRFGELCSEPGRAFPRAAFTDFPAIWAEDSSEQQEGSEEVERAIFEPGLSDYPMALIHLDVEACAGKRQYSNYIYRIKEVHSIIGTLLHEMCHVILELYSCKGIHGGSKNAGFAHICRERICGQIWLMNVVAGHGRAWQRLAKCVEENCETLLGIKTKVRSFGSLLDELRRPQGWRPSRCDIQKYFGNVDEDRMVKYIKQIIDAHKGDGPVTLNEALNWVTADEEEDDDEEAEDRQEEQEELEESEEEPDDEMDLDYEERYLRAIADVEKPISIHLRSQGAAEELMLM